MRNRIFQFLSILTLSLTLHTSQSAWGHSERSEKILDCDGGAAALTRQSYPSRGTYGFNYRLTVRDPNINHYFEASLALEPLPSESVRNLPEELIITRLIPTDDQEHPSWIAHFGGDFGSPGREIRITRFGEGLLLEFYRYHTQLNLAPVVGERLANWYFRSCW